MELGLNKLFILLQFQMSNLRQRTAHETLEVAVETGGTRDCRPQRTVLTARSRTDALLSQPLRRLISRPGDISSSILGFVQMRPDSGFQSFSGEGNLIACTTVVQTGPQAIP